jgi:hypothetical protein
MLDIIVKRQETYVKNAQRLFGNMNGDVYYQGGAFNYQGKSSALNNQVYHFLDEP